VTHPHVIRWSPTDAADSGPSHWRSNMIDTTSEAVIAFAQAAGELPRRRRGGPTQPRTNRRPPDSCTTSTGFGRGRSQSGRAGGLNHEETHDPCRSKFRPGGMALDRVGLPSFRSRNRERQTNRGDPLPYRVERPAPQYHGSGGRHPGTSREVQLLINGETVGATIPTVSHDSPNANE